MPSLPDRAPTVSIAVLGSKATAVRLVEDLAAAGLGPVGVVTTDDTGDARSRLGDLERLCKRLGLPLTVSRRSSDAYAALLSLHPSLVLVAGWYRLIPDETLAAVPQGFVGAHYSALPRYRGSAPVVWQLINRETEVGYSVFRLGAGMDEGEIAASGSVPRGDGYIGEVLDRLDAAALSELVRIAPAIAAGTHRFTDQPTDRASYVSMRTPADGRIDWRRSADEVVRAIRAQSDPYPGAWSTVGDTEVRVWRASVEDTADYLGVPGHVVRLIDGAPVIATGDGGVLLESYDGPPATLATRFL